jgi:2-iminobutanoate/2-iminopropanoate deaminase
MVKSIVETSEVPPPDATYSNATVGGGFIFLAGQVGLDLKGEVKAGIAEQTRQALKNVKAIIEAAGSSLENVMRVGVYLRDINDFDEMDKIYRTFFPQNPPARTAVQALIADNRCV